MDFWRENRALAHRPLEVLPEQKMRLAARYLQGLSEAALQRDAFCLSGEMPFPARQADASWSADSLPWHALPFEEVSADLRVVL